MEKRLVLVSHNEKKIQELADILAPLGWTLLTAAEVKLPEVDETGTTFAENAVLKAEAGAQACGLPCLGDDSGIEIDALDGKPGVYSKRWAWETGEERFCTRALKELAGVPENARGAQFQCVLAWCVPGEDTQLFSGVSRGRILEEWTNS